MFQKFAQDAHIEVAQTCQLALARIGWLLGEEVGDGIAKNGTTTNEAKRSEATTKTSQSSPTRFTSVDPAPPSRPDDVEALRTRLLDETADLFSRYRAMFALRDLNSDSAALALADGLKCRDSALFRHEIAYVLGQMTKEVTVTALAASLADLRENEMVRHECAEALGAIGSDQANAILQKYALDDRRVVRESVEVAMDMADYANSGQFQYADLLAKSGS